MRPRRPEILFAATLACGCQLNVDGIPIAPSGAGGMKDASVEPIVDSGTRDAMVEPDATSATGPVQHPSCETAAIEPLPDLPALPTDAVGRPAFDWWRDVPCSEVTEALRCDDPDATNCLGCVVPVAGASGYCTAYSTAESCTPYYFGTPIVYRDGACEDCVEPDLKRTLCCAQIEGIDCRAWPFEGTSKPGDVCARHDDCEPGLVCRARSEAVIGHCTCPEQSVLPELASMEGCRAEM